MSKARWIFGSICTVVCFGVGLALAIPGLELAFGTDVTCGDWVMNRGDQCRNVVRSSAYLYDYDEQRSRNREEGFHLASFGGILLFAGVLFVFGGAVAYLDDKRRARIGTTSTG
ncbi:hypothetical protein [Mycolicibacterium sp. HK-90]|uniref:hypothetical protein n=1 Tax=Mycolicibacterium sp. HK-90 TaxID=3056937 RepID=UPI0026586C67|nr:hypothetical protein [Mycolicibacterium sp. HK-90]WKG05714.1 hypothetical protein QU592_11810 [Mycolicibacterium sp. HK-90]